MQNVDSKACLQTFWTYANLKLLADVTWSQMQTADADKMRTQTFGICTPLVNIHHAKMVRGSRILWWRHKGEQQRVSQCGHVYQLASVTVLKLLVWRCQSLGVILDQWLTSNEHVTPVAKSCNYHAPVIRHVQHLLTESITQMLASSLINSRLFLLQLAAVWRSRGRRAQNTAACALLSTNGRADASPDFDNSTGFQCTNASSTRQWCWRVEWRWLVCHRHTSNISRQWSHNIYYTHACHQNYIPLKWRLLERWQIRQDTIVDGYRY